MASKKKKKKICFRLCSLCKPGYTIVMWICAERKKCAFLKSTPKISGSAEKRLNKV